MIAVEADSGESRVVAESEALLFDFLTVGASAGLNDALEYASEACARIGAEPQVGLEEVERCFVE